MTGYLFSLNGGALSWRSSRQGGVTLSSAEAEFVAVSQAGQEAVYLRALLRGFNFRQVGTTEIWEDNAFCTMMSENPAIGSALGTSRLECIICGSSYAMATSSCWNAQDRRMWPMR
jgi:hypothetical protein